MQIIESTCVGKLYDERLNEDALIVTDHYVAVFDGATSSAPFDGTPGGLLSRIILEKAFLEIMLESSEGFDFILNLNAAMFDAQKQDAPRFSDPSKRLMASAIIYSDKQKQIWNYGDCRYLINGKMNCFNKRVDTMSASVRSFVDQAYINSGMSSAELLNHDLGSKAIEGILKLQPLFANKNDYWGYPILDGGTLCKDFFECIQLAPGDEVVLASDGYPLICSSLKESEIELQRVLREDPLLITNVQSVKGYYPGMRSFDDRTYCRFIV